MSRFALGVDVKENKTIVMFTIINDNKRTMTRIKNDYMQLKRDTVFALDSI